MCVSVCACAHARGCCGSRGPFPWAALGFNSFFALQSFWAPTVEQLLSWLCVPLPAPPLPRPLPLPLRWRALAAGLQGNCLLGYIAWVHAFLHLVLRLLVFGTSCVMACVLTELCCSSVILGCDGGLGTPPPTGEVRQSSDTPSLWLGKSAWKASASLLTPGWQRSQVSPGGILGHTPFLVHVLASALCCALPAAPVACSTAFWIKGAQWLCVVHCPVKSVGLSELETTPGDKELWGPQPAYVLGLLCHLGSWSGFFRSDGRRPPTASRVTLLCFGIPKQRET